LENFVLISELFETNRRRKIMADQKYVVAARVGTSYKDCIVVPEDAIIVATHRVVYGPDTKEKCEQWKRSHCK
jgi:hypothetical protein